MKRMKSIIAAVCLVFTFIIAAPSVFGGILGGVTAEASSSIKLNKSSAVLYEGKSLKLKVKGTSKKAKWSSSNKKVAVVSQTGKVTAKKKGKATITAKVGKKSAKCVITVKSKSGSVKANIKEVKAYISRYGSLNENGDRFIKWSYSNNGTVCTFGIVYERKKDSLKFLYLSDSDLAESSIEMTIKTDNKGNVVCKYNLLFSDYTTYCAAKASIKANKYRKNSTVYFNVTDGVNGSELQELANIELSLAFAGWDTLLSSETGLRLRDIGFSSYK